MLNSIEQTSHTERNEMNSLEFPQNLVIRDMRLYWPSWGKRVRGLSVNLHLLIYLNSAFAGCLRCCMHGFDVINKVKKLKSSGPKCTLSFSRNANICKLSSICLRWAPKWPSRQTFSGVFRKSEKISRAEVRQTTGNRPLLASACFPLFYLHECQYAFPTSLWVSLTQNNVTLSIWAFGENFVISDSTQRVSLWVTSQLPS